MGGTVLFISPQFPPHFANFVVSLRNAGCTVVAIGDCSYHSLSGDLKHNLADFYELPTLEDYDRVYRAVAQLIHNHGRISWVQSHNEHWLVLEARIREDFNIKGGYLPNEIIEFRKKSEMKKIFQGLGLAVAQGEVLDSYEKVLEFVHGAKGGKTKGVGYPIVVKPDTGVGAVDTFKLSSDKEVADFFQSTFKNSPKPYIFEEYIEGDLFTFDGLTTREGKILYCGTFQYDKGVMDTVTDQSSGMYYYIKRDISDDLLDAGKKCVEAFKVRGHFFHFEFFRRHKDSKLVPLEVNLRLPGGNTIDMYNYAFDANFYQLWADVVAQKEDKLSEWSKRCEKESNANYFVCYAGRKFTPQYVHSHESLLGRCRPPQNENDVEMCMNWEVAPLFRQAMGDYAYIFRSKTENAILRMVNDVHAAQ